MNVCSHSALSATTGAHVDTHVSRGTDTHIVGVYKCFTRVTRHVSRCVYTRPSLCVHASVHACGNHTKHVCCEVIFELYCTLLATNKLK